MSYIATALVKAGFDPNQARDERGQWSGIGARALTRVSERTGASPNAIRSFSGNAARASFHAIKAGIAIRSVIASPGEMLSSLPGELDTYSEALEHLSNLKDDLRELRGDLRRLGRETSAVRRRAMKRVRDKLRRVDGSLKGSSRTLARRKAK